MFSMTLDQLASQKLTTESASPTGNIRAAHRLNGPPAARLPSKRVWWRKTNPGGASEGWEQEVAFAKKVVDDFIFKLPEESRVEALRIGYELARISDGYRGPDCLGDCCRSAERIRLYLPIILPFTSLGTTWA